PPAAPEAAASISMVRLLSAFHVPVELQMPTQLPRVGAWYIRRPPRSALNRASESRTGRSVTPQMFMSYRVSSGAQMAAAAVITDGELTAAMRDRLTLSLSPS